MSYHPAWAAEHETALGELLANGFSFAQSAAGLNEKFGTKYTRNSTIGKAHRLGLSGRVYVYIKRPPGEVEATKRLKAERRNERRRTQRVSFPMARSVNLEALRCIEVEPLHKSLLELGPNDCRYPYGEGPYTFCGQLQMEGRSYCGGHFALSLRNGRGS